MSNNRNHREEVRIPNNLTKSQRRAFQNPWFWVSVAALIIIPFTVAAWISNDNYVNYMTRQGCQVVNTFDNGTKVWECERER